MRFNVSLSSRGSGSSADDCVRQMLGRLQYELKELGYKIVDKDGKEVDPEKFPLPKMPLTSYRK